MNGGSLARVWVLFILIGTFVISPALPISIMLRVLTDVNGYRRHLLDITGSMPLWSIKPWQCS